jgi:hypothetical protein
MVPLLQAELQSFLQLSPTERTRKIFGIPDQRSGNRR